jgi:pimeloyl-ACP methyl ester carboxylesterase
MKKMMSTCVALICAIGAFISLRWLTKSREDTNWRDASRPGKLINVDGVGLHYVEAGSGPAIVMIHGFGGQTFSFRYQMAEFARDHRCIAIDLKGFGYSERPEQTDARPGEDGDYSLVEQARLVLRAMDEMGIDRAVLIGHSMGGEVVARAAELAPERVDKLVLVATAPGYPLRLGPRLPFMRAFLPGFARLARRNARKNLFYDPKSVDIDAIMAEYEKPGRIYGSLNTVWQMWGDVRKQPKLDHSKITMPVLILWAEKERVLPFDQRLLRWLRKRLPEAKVVTIPRTGHMLLEENPTAANEALRRFLDGGAAPDGDKTAVRAAH